MDANCTYSPKDILEELIQRYPALSVCERDFESAFELLVGAFSGQGKLLVCGNGGSAADSEHIVGELMKSFRLKRPVETSFAAAYREANGTDVPSWLEGALPAVSLISHTALSTAFGNDEAAVGVYAQQVYGYGTAGDVLIGISTSGTSQNVIEAAKVARAKGMKAISLTGANETELTKLADVAIRVPETETFKVQEYHLPIYHCLCAMVEAEMFGGIA